MKGQTMTTPTRSGYAPVNGLEMYYEVHGDGEPLFLLHGGFGMTGMFAPIIEQYAASRQVITADLQAHGRTADIDRPLTLENHGSDVAALIEHLGFAQADVMGYSMGAGAALQAAIQRPDLVRKLVVLSMPYKRDGWFPEQRAQMDQMNAAGMPFMLETPMYKEYVAIAPNPGNFETLMNKMGDLVRRPYDWTEEVRALSMPVLIMAGDADGLPPSHMAEFFALLGGGLRDGSWDNSGMSKSQLAILPATTHYNALESPLLSTIVNAFLDAPVS